MKAIKYAITLIMTITVIISSVVCYAEENTEYETLKAQYEELEEKYNALYGQYQDAKKMVSKLLEYMEQDGDARVDSGESNADNPMDENIVYSGEWGILTFKRRG